MFFFVKQKSAYEMRISDWSSDVFSSDLLIAPFWFFKYLIPEMKKVGGGTFVNISSLNAMRPVLGLPSYAAAKAGLEALSRSVAVDYADSNIRSNCISVGPVRVAAKDRKSVV